MIGIYAFNGRTIFLLVVCSSDKEIRTETYRENFDGLYRKPYYYTAASEQSFAAFSFTFLQKSMQRVIFAKERESNITWVKV